MPSSRARLLTLALFLGLVPEVGAWEQNEGSFDRTLQVSGPVDLDVTTGSGSIRVHS